MKTHRKKRLDIMIEAPLMARMLSVLDAQGVTGYTVMPALAGKGKDGSWHRDGLAGRAGSVVLIFCILDESRVDEVLGAVYQLVSRQIGIVTLSEVYVVRPEHF